MRIIFTTVALIKESHRVISPVAKEASLSANMFTVAVAAAAAPAVRRSSREGQESTNACPRALGAPDARSSHESRPGKMTHGIVLPHR